MLTSNDYKKTKNKTEKLLKIIKKSIARCDDIDTYEDDVKKIEKICFKLNDYI